jgi:hypothetical protein
MLVTELHRALPAAHDTVRAWLGAVIRPPVFLLARAGASNG